MRVWILSVLLLTIGCGLRAPPDDELSRERPPADVGVPEPGDWIDEAPGPIVRPDLVAEGGIVRDRTTGLEWQRVHSGRFANGQLEEVCNDLVIDGKSDFRLPTRSEILSIVDLAVADDKAPAFAEVLAEGVPADAYVWTATPAYGLAEARWVVGTHDGVAARCVEGMWLVRCVRGGRVSSGPRYLLEGEVVRDLRTALVWQRGIEEGLHDKASASLRCAARGARLPSVHELHSIVDARRRSPAIDPVFVDTPRETFWSASENAKYAHYAWAVSFDTGETVYANRDSQFRVRCVR